MKYLVMSALLVVVLHLVPEQTDKTNDGHDKAQQQPPTATVNQAPIARPSPPKKENGANCEANQANWCEIIMKPVIDNWPLIIVAALGIFFANKNLKAVDKQAALMTGSIHVDGVRVIDLQEGRTAICFVTVANSGMIARQVSLTMAVDMLSDTTKYPDPLATMIPAQSTREFSISSGLVMNSGNLQRLDGNTFRVRGRITWDKGENDKSEYCYKYNPYPHGEHPRGLPQFVPCDFNMGRDISVSARSTAVATATGTLTAKVENPLDEIQDKS